MRIQKKQPWRLTDVLAQKLHTRLGFGMAVGTLLLGGTAAAITLWPAPTVTQTALKPLPSGNHIVGYDTQNCNYFGTLDGTPPKTTDEKVYYEVRQGSTLTDAQLQSGLQGVCEENISNNAISAVEKSLPVDRQGDSTDAFTITAISTNSITVSLDPHYTLPLFASPSSVTKPNQVYTRFDSNLEVYDESTRSSFSDLKVGDTIKMILKDTSGQPASLTYQPANHPENQLTEAIVKIPALTADPSDFYKGIATEFVRVNPCTGSPTGFCRAYDFAK